MKPYVGIKKKCKTVVFETQQQPSKETPPEIDIIYGSFNSREDAEEYVRAIGELSCGDGQ